MKNIDSWAREVKNEQAIPASFTTFWGSIPHSIQFPYTVFTPAERWYRRRNYSKLLVLLEDRLFVVEKVKKELQSNCFLFQDINYIETGRLLLHSWLTVNGMVEGKLVTVTVEYNSVVEHIFQPIIEKIRTNSYHLDLADLVAEKARALQFEQEKSKFEALLKINYKYMNFGKQSLLAGERIRQFILEPDIRIKVWRYFERILSFTHLTILTDHELIIVKDDDSHRRTRDAGYGGIWRYIPLHKIVEMKLEKNEINKLPELTLRLPEDVSFRALFSESKLAELEQLQHRLRDPYQEKDAV
jgi:hypothetical protein